MSLKTKNLLSTLAVLAAATAPAPAQSATELLEVAQRTAATVSPCRATAGDLAGEVALRLWSRHRDVLERGGFRSYVDASVRNAWRDHVRKRRVPVFSDLPSDGTGAGPEPSLPAPDEQLATAVVDEFKDALSASDREVLEHLESGQTDREIAAAMSRTRHWVRGAVQRIRRQAERYFVPD